MWSSQKKCLIPDRYLLCSAINFHQHPPIPLRVSTPKVIPLHPAFLEILKKSEKIELFL